MITSLVVKIQAKETGQIRGSTTPSVHGFWYHQMGNANPILADEMHQEDKTPPFTLSPILDIPFPKRGTQYINAGEEGWFRVAALSRCVSQVLIEEWAPQLPETINLAGINWRVKGWTLDGHQHPWACQVPYKVLGEKHLFSTSPPSSWRLKFVTPTTFHGVIGHFPFPLPDSLVSSWLRRWQAFAPIGLPEELPDLVREGMVVSSYRLKTVPVRHGKRLTVGCVGSYKLHALDLPPALRAAVDTLVQYAFYVGSGHRTTQGMGMTRCKK